MKDNFKNFYFPTQNSQCFTVIIQKELANHWEEALSDEHGAPRTVKNDADSIIDTLWKVKYDFKGIKTTEITVHIYKNNANNNSKRVSKLLVQGSDISSLYSYVFT